MASAGSSSHRWALALHVAATLTALVAVGLLGFSVASSRPSYASASDTVWAMAACVPEAVTLVLAAGAALVGLRASRAVERRAGARLLAGGALLALLDLIGGAWGMLNAVGDDSRWLCLTAGALGAFAAALLAAGGAAWMRASGAAVG